MGADIKHTVILTISVKIPLEGYGVTAEHALERVSKRFDYSAREYTDIVEFFNLKGMDPLFLFSLPNNEEVF